MLSRSKVLAVLVPVAIVALVIAAGSSVMARPGLWCSLATPCAAKTMEKVASDQKGWLGVEIQELTPELREVMGIDEETEGVLVAGVTKNSPAEKAGIAKGDVIETLNSKAVEGTTELVNNVSRRKPGEVLTIVLMRDGRERTVRVTLGRRPRTTEEEFTILPPKPRGPGKEAVPEPETPEQRPPRSEFLPPLEHLRLEFDRGRLGVNVVDLNADLGGHFGTRKGVLVTDVVEGSAAEEAGIKAGDIIIAVDGKSVESREELVRVLGNRREGDKVELALLRKGKEMKLSATLEEGPFMAWVEGMRKKGSSIPQRYITPRVEEFKGNAELRRRMDELSRQMEELQKKLDKLSKDMGSEKK